MTPLLLLAALASLAAATPMSYHALTDAATGSVLIFPASRRPPPSDLRGLPMDDDSARKEDGVKGFLSSWFKPEARPVVYEHHNAPQHYEPYYHNGAYPISGYPTRYPDYPNRYPDRYDKYPDKFNKYPDKFNKYPEKWHGLLDKFHGLYYNKYDKIHGLYYDKYDKYDKFDKFDKFDKYDKYEYPVYGPPHGGYQGLGWGSGGYHHYPNSDRPYEYGYEGGPYEG